MRVVFKRVIAENFLSFPSLDFSIPEMGLWIVYGEVEGVSSGSNGAGKSALFETIVWVLYGKTLRGGKLDDVIRKGTAMASVSLDFFVDQQKYRIVRSRDVGGSHRVSLYLCGENDELSDISGSGVLDTNGKIVNVIGGVTFDIFRNAVCFGQGLPYRFIQATDAEKKRIFDEILNLDWISIAKDRCADLLRCYEQEDEKLNFTMNSAQSTLQSLINDLEKTTVGENENDPASTFACLRTALKGKAELVKRIERLELINKGRQDKKEVLSEKLKEVEKEIEIFKNSVMTHKEAAETMKSAIDEVIDAVRKLKEAGWCPLCLSPLSETMREKLLKDYRKKWKALSEERTSTLEMIEIYRNSINQLNSQLRKINLQISKLDERIERTLDDLESAREEAVWFETQIARLRTELRHLVSEEKREDVRMETLSKKIAETNRKIDLIAHRKRNVDLAVEILRFWNRSFGSKGLKTLVLENVLPELNRIVSIYLDAMNMTRSRLSFTSQNVESGGVSERIGIHITEDDHERAYETLSGGEKRRYDFVILLALQEFISRMNNVDFSIQVFDEVCESLDDNGIESVISLLENVASTSGRAIFVISHSDLAQLTGNILKVTKSDGDSKLVS